MKVCIDDTVDQNPHDDAAHKKSKQSRLAKRQSKDQRKISEEHDLIGIGSQFEE